MRRYASAGYSDRNVSVRLSVTRRYCVKTKKASGMISSPSGSPKTLVFRCQISSPNSKGFPPNGGLKQGSVVKIQRSASCKRQYLDGVLISRIVTEPTLLYYSFLPVRRYASAGNCDRNVSVCPSVCLSVTRRYCVKTKKASGMISSPFCSPKTLVYV